MKWLKDNKSWLLSGLAVYPLGFLTGVFKDLLPFLQVTFPTPVWVTFIVSLTPVAVFTAVYLNQKAKLKKKIEILELKNSESEQSGSHEALTDPLTKTGNLRVLKALYDIEIPDAEISRKEVCGLLVDIDDFDRFNSPPHSFRKASDLIRQLGQFLEKSIKGTDCVVRYGGDEFLIILFDTPLAGAKAVSNNLLKGVASEPFYIEGIQDKQEISISIGYTKYIYGHDDSKTFEDRLWLALQDAKSEPGKSASSNR